MKARISLRVSVFIWRDERLALRRLWLQHNRDYITRLLRDIRDAVDTVAPGMPLGLMTGESAYSGYGFADWATALAGTRGVPVKWRPGGGFYNDDMPLAALAKAHAVGRQTGLLPESLTDVQWEHENFPYQVLKKSRTMFAGEIAAALGAGCTGVALNLMGITPDPFDEYRPYFDAVGACRRFFDQAVAAFGRRLAPSGGDDAYTQFPLPALPAWHAVLLTSARAEV